MKFIALNTLQTCDHDLTSYNSQFCSNCVRQILLTLIKGVGHDCAAEVLSYFTTTLPTEKFDSELYYLAPNNGDMLYNRLVEHVAEVFMMKQSSGFYWNNEGWTLHECEPVDSGKALVLVGSGQMYPPYQPSNNFSIARALHCDEFDVRKSQLFDMINHAVDHYLQTWSYQQWADIYNRVYPVHTELATASIWTMCGNSNKRELAREPARTVKTMCNSRLLMIGLKSELYRRILIGTVVRGQMHALVERQASILEDINNLLSFMTVIFMKMFLLAINLAKEALVVFEGHRARAYVELVFGIALLYLLFKLAVLIKRLAFLFRGWVVTKYTLSSVANTGENRFISKRITSDGVLYEFVYQNKLVVIPHVETIENVRRIDEMALPGSKLYPSSQRNVGAILVATEGVELTVVGCFWRFGDYLVTAKHVANAVSSGVAEVYLANHKENTKGLRRVNLDKVYRMERDFFDIDENNFPKGFDVFTRKLSLKQWSTVGVCEPSTKNRSTYNQTVSAVGFQDGLLMTSAGKTLEGSGVVELFHTASTHPGFSGGPLFSGNSVVGMHIQSDCNKNVAIRIELIKYCLLRKNESNQSFESEDSVDFKYQGYGVKFERYGDDDDYAAYNDRGDVFYGVKSKYAEFIEEEEAVEYMPKRKASHTYRDESAPINGVINLPREKAVHCASCPQEQAVAVKYLDDNADELVKLGFDPTKYVWPIISEKTERVSCVNHLKLYHERVNSITRKPTDAECRRVVQVTLQQMAANRYDAPCGYRDPQNILRVINSNKVDSKKSPGHPYQAMGLMKNGDVLKHYGDGFAEIVEREWDSEFFMKIFIKAEPTKAEKLERGMARILAGMPLHKMVKNQVIFENFRQALLDGWEKSPIKYKFTPVVAGHIKHLANYFGKRKVHGSDKHNWDFNCFMYILNLVCEVICELAIQPPDMSDTDFECYKKDVRRCFDEIGVKAKYRCTNGEVFQSIWDGIMKSGWLLTIDANSIAQLIFDNLVKVILGWTDEQILGEIIIAGGDDVLQTFPPDYNLQSYLDVAKSLGFILSDFETTKTFDGCEFFSSRFYLKDGIWTFKPERFTKHIMRLRTNKVEDLAGALASHMLNHAWDSGKFLFLSKMYRNLRKSDPNNFPVTFLKSQKQLQYKLSGCEFGGTEADELSQYVDLYHQLRE